MPNSNLVPTYRCLCAIIVSEPKAWIVWVLVIARTCDACKTDNVKGHWTVNWSGHVYTFTYLPCHVTHVGELVSVLARLVISTIPEMPSPPVSHTQVGWSSTGEHCCATAKHHWQRKWSNNKSSILLCFKATIIASHELHLTRLLTRAVNFVSEIPKGVLMLLPCATAFLTYMGKRPLHGIEN